MKKTLLKKIILSAVICVFGFYQMNAQNVKDVVITRSGVALPIAVTGTTIQVETGSSITVNFNVFHATLYIERAFSVVKVGEDAPGSAANFFNASNNIQTYGVTMDFAESRVINIPADGGTTAAGQLVTVGDIHTLRLNSKRWVDATTSAWGTLFDVNIELVAPGTLGLADYQQLEGVSIYPNPSSDVLNVNCPAGSKVALYNVMGGKVKSVEKSSKNFTMPISDLASGLYIMKVENEGKFYSKKLQVK